MRHFFDRLLFGVFLRFHLLFSLVFVLAKVLGILIRNNRKRMSKRHSMKKLKAFKPYMIKKIKKRMIFTVKQRSSIQRNPRNPSHLIRPPEPKMLKPCSPWPKVRSMSRRCLNNKMTNKTYKLIKMRMRVSHCLKRCGKSNIPMRSRR
jgi:hypothetical protein